jgi:DNA mismatch endonuclease (patch repair protein)
MRGCRAGRTRPELALRSHLFRLGLRFRVGVRPIPGVRITADILFPRARLVVFVDGCFWHGCPQHLIPPRTNEQYWDAKIARNRERDRSNERTLSEQGWTVVRVWEHSDVTAAAANISALVQMRSTPAFPSNGVQE